MFMMSFEGFVKEVQDNIREYLPESYENAKIDVRLVDKLNDEYTALNVRRADKPAAVSINLDKLYERYADGAELTEIMGSIAEMAQTQPPGFDINALMDYDNAKEQLFVRVSNIENNRGFLENVPYTQVDNLALTYHICVSNGEHGIASATITNDIMESFGITKEQLHQDVMDNSQKLFPANIQPMMNVMMRMAGMMPEMMAGPEGKSFDAQLQEISFNGDDMLVLSNATTQNGASALFYPDVLEKIGEQAGQNFFILPSSIHETLIVPDDGRFDYQTLESMVKEINAAE